MEIAAKYWFPGEMVIGMKDELEKYAKGPTSRAKMTVKRIFKELVKMPTIIWGRQYLATLN